MAGAVRFTENAEKDVDAILSYTLTTWGEAQAQAYIDGLYDLLGLLSENPAAGRSRPELAPGLRSFPYRKHFVFYVSLEAELVVIRILASRQEIESGRFMR